MAHGHGGGGRKWRAMVSAAVAMAVWCGGGRAAVVRPELPLNEGWRFSYVGALEVSPPIDVPANWTAVTLPHTWNARDGADGGDDYARGAGWYVRTFAAPPAWRGRRILIEFAGASRDADVYVNGRRIGEHRGAFARFRFDLTDAIRFDGPNLIAVRVSNAPDGLPPISADFTFFGGLYRAVRLFAVDAVHVDPLDYGADAFYVSTRDLDADHAEVEMRAGVRNNGATAASVTLHFELRDASGTPVATADSALEVPADGATLGARSLALAHPHRWNGRADPYLYTAVVSVRAGDRVVDEVTERVGVRSFHLDPDRGFFLNGQYLDLHGVSRHQDRAGKGWAIAPADDREDFSFVREIGATALRVAHYPQSDLWFDLADENGIVVWAEIPVVNEVAPTDAYAENAREQLRELIRQHYNHPSICFWGVGNETREVGDRGGHETPNAPTADRLIAALGALAHEEDATRLTTYASHHGNTDVRNFRTDVVAFNRYFGWYGGQADDLGPWADKMHRAYPTLRFGFSEYGAGANATQHESTVTKPKPTGAWHPEEYQAYFHERQWQALAARPFVWGKFVWNLFDFAADARAEGDTPGMNDKGLVTYDRRTRKDAFYWYKANWSAEPVLYLTGRRFVDRTDRHVEVKAYANASTVELVLNGRELGPMTEEGRIFRRMVELADGENRIVVRARIGDHDYTDACTWILKGAPAGR